MRKDVPSGEIALHDAEGSRPLDRLLRPPFLTVFAGIMALGSAVIGLQFLGSVDEIVEVRGKVATGDFISFYTAATIVREGRGESLYDLGAQLEVQTSLTGRTEGDRWSGYINPPLLAAALAPLAGLPYPMAFRLFAFLMMLLFAGTVLMLRGALPGLRRAPVAWWTAWLLVFSFHPVFRTMVGGQNTVFTLFLLAGLYATWRRERWLLAGLFLGLLSYKPQFVPLFGLVLLVEQRWPALAAAGVVAAGHYALGGVCCGWSWPAQFLAALQSYRPLEATSFHSHIALIPALEFAIPRPLHAWLIGASIAAVLLGVVWAYRQYASEPRHVGVLFGLLVAAAMLVSPHLQYYDVGLLVLPVLLAVDGTLRQGGSLSLRARLVLAAGYLLYPLYQLSEAIHFQPLVLWSVSCFVWLLYLMSRRPTAYVTA
jgi:hypothetical protein